MPSRLPSVLFITELPSQELQAARLDGELFAIDECFSPIDEIERRDHRARSLAALFPSRLIAEQRTAAWIFGVLDRPPIRHQFCADISARVRPAVSVRLSVREVVLDESDLLSYGGFRVTTPLRTVVDLARFSDRFDQAERAIVGALMELGRFGSEECATVMNRRRNLPGKQRALARIQSTY